MKKLSIFISIFFLYACSTVPLEEYANYPLLKSEKIPTNIHNKKINVLIVNGTNIITNQKDIFNLEKETNKYHQFIKIMLENQLASRGYINLIDRRILSQVSEESKLAELQNKTINQKIILPDYIITFNFHSSDIGERESSIDMINLALNIAHLAVASQQKYVAYNEAPKYENKYEWFVKISGNVKVYSFPNLELENTIQFAGENSIQKNKISKLNESNRRAITSPAIEKAIAKIKPRLFSALNPKSYVLAMKRYKDDQYIVQINSGTNENIKKGDKFSFFRTATITNPIDEKQELESQFLGRGKVTPFITPKRSWVYIKNDVAQKLKIGHWCIKKL